MKRRDKVLELIERGGDLATPIDAAKPFLAPILDMMLDKNIIFDMPVTQIPLISIECSAALRALENKNYFHFDLRKFCFDFEVYFQKSDIGGIVVLSPDKYRKANNAHAPKKSRTRSQPAPASTDFLFNEHVVHRSSGARQQPPRREYEPKPDPDWQETISPRYKNREVIEDETSPIDPRLKGREMFTEKDKRSWIGHDNLAKGVASTPDEKRIARNICNKLDTKYGVML